MAERYDLPTLETVGGATGWSVAGHQLTAYRSLARWAGADLSTVMRHAANNTLSTLIERRSVKPRVRPSEPGYGARSPWDCYSVLAYKATPTS
jgi:hypothetical protein